MCLRHVRLEVPAGASFFLAALPARSRPYGKGVSLARSEAGPTRLGAEPPGAFRAGRFLFVGPLGRDDPHRWVACSSPVTIQPPGAVFQRRPAIQASRPPTPV